METNFQKIQQILSASSLSSEDQENLLVLFSRTLEEKLEPIAELFAESPEWIEKINKNYKAKQKALADNDTAAIENIVQEEEALLQSLL